MAKSKRRTVLRIVETDSSFEKVESHRGTIWRGKCIHCRSWLLIDSDGSYISRATIEHIVPRSHGGGDELENLALACAACNHEKGRRHDLLKPSDPALVQFLDRLRQERMERWRPPAAHSLNASRVLDS